MAASARYFDLLREMKNAYNHRLRLVESAQQRGIKPTARLFATTVPTVRKWLRRFQQHGPSGLHEHSRARHRQAHKTPLTREAQLVQLRKTLPTFGARRLIREFDLRIGHNALERIWHEHGLMAKRRKKYQRKQDLARIKAQWALFQQISADTKDLDDIPRYWQQAQRLHLPLIQYTAREVRSGLLFWAFAQDRRASASAVFAARIQQHLERYGVSLRDLVWQTDNGGEFKGDFPKALGDSQHVRIPPAAHTYQSDVETVHRLEEDEFFDLEDFSSRGDFLAKVHTYQLYFNLVRPNSHKENLSPWQIIERLAPRSPLQLCLLPPVFLDYHLNDSGGYDVPGQPYVRGDKRRPSTKKKRPRRKTCGVLFSAIASKGKSCGQKEIDAKPCRASHRARNPRRFSRQGRFQILLTGPRRRNIIGRAATLFNCRQFLYPAADTNEEQKSGYHRHRRKCRRSRSPPFGIPCAGWQGTHRIRGAAPGRTDCHGYGGVPAVGARGKVYRELGRRRQRGHAPERVRAPGNRDTPGQGPGHRQPPVLHSCRSRFGQPRGTEPKGEAVESESGSSGKGVDR